MDAPAAISVTTGTPVIRTGGQTLLPIHTVIISNATITIIKDEE